MGSALIRFNKFITVETCQRPPRRVRMPRPFSSPAIARRLVAPPARISSTTARRSSAWRSAFLAIASLSGCPPRPARLRAAAPLGLPRRTPRAFAAASASLVRREIASRSCCATSAMMPTVRSFASGMSAATNRTPLSRSVSRNAAFRDSRSSLAMRAGAKRTGRPNSPARFPNAKKPQPPASKVVIRRVSFRSSELDGRNPPKTCRIAASNTRISNR